MYISYSKNFNNSILSKFNLDDSEKKIVFYLVDKHMMNCMKGYQNYPFQSQELFNFIVQNSIDILKDRRYNPNREIFATFSPTGITTDPGEIMRLNYISAALYMQFFGARDVFVQILDKWDEIGYNKRSPYTDEAISIYDYARNILENDKSFNNELFIK